jgi:hypothetical protein
MASRNRVAKALDRLEKRTGELQRGRLEQGWEAAEQRLWEETLDRFGAVLAKDLVDS